MDWFLYVRTSVMKELNDPRSLRPLLKFSDIKETQVKNCAAQKEQNFQIDVDK